MADSRVMIVDDEELNLLIIEEFLSEESLLLESFSDPLAAWEQLAKGDQQYDLIVLDRMMPGLDGVDFLRQMKKETRFVDLPVIMQTAASSPEQVREGLEAGAYYYLTKPYEPEALISIVRAALEDQRYRNQLRHVASRFSESKRLLSALEYRFSTLADINTLVPLLASLCPEPDVVAPGLVDLMVNAVEHGNLGVSYHQKAQLKLAGTWEEEIYRRLALPENAARYAMVKAEFSSDLSELQFTISDQGDGFDWHKYLEFDPERAFDPNGRGIAMARLMSFKTMIYEGKGNVVRVTVNLVPAATA